MAKRLKSLLVLAMLALLPLHTLAAVSGLCAAYSASHHGAAHHDPAPPQDDGAAGASPCSFCAACCTGASYAPQGPGPAAFSAAGIEPIPFLGRHPDSPHPDKLDRPPLSR